jgi:alpha-amylase
MGKKMKYMRTLALSVLLLLASCTITIQPAATPFPTPTPAVRPTPLPLLGSSGLPWWNEAIFYEVFVRSFYDSNGDGIGDLNGLIAKLDYLNDGDPATTTDLGVTALWLMPIHPSPSYHGYDVTDYYAVNPAYGTLADFRRLLEEAHARQIRVIIDFVINHTSVAHPWFVEAQDPQSPKRDWYRWSATDPGGVGPWGQQVWHRSPAGDYYYGVFWEGMPDLNYTNPAVQEEIATIARFWLEEVGVDGLRVDGARYIVEETEGVKQILADSAGTHAWYRAFRPLYKAANPAAMTVGEVWTTNDVVATYVQGDEFDLAFNFDLASALVTSANRGEADAARLALAISLALLPQEHSATFLTNHDIDRVMSQLGDDVNKAKRAATLLLTMPGAPFLYYGEEIGMVGRKPDEDIRLPMQWNGGPNGGFTTGTPWRALNPDAATNHVAAQQADPNSLWAHYRALITLRHAHPALHIGETFKMKSSHRAVLPYLRAKEDELLLVINNLSEETVHDYGLTLEAGPLTPDQRYRIQPVWGEGPFLEVTADAKGGFKSYQPTAQLWPGQTLVLALQETTP